MRGLVLEVERDAERGGQRHTQEVRVGGAVEVRLDDPDGVGRPAAACITILHDLALK